MLHGLYHNTEDKDKYEYDVYSGVSAGAINLFALSLFEKGEMEKALDYMGYTWQTMGNKDVFRKWKGGIAGGFDKPGLLDNSPLRETLRQQFEQLGGKIK